LDGPNFSGTAKAQEFENMVNEGEDLPGFIVVGPPTAPYKPHKPSSTIYTTKQLIVLEMNVSSVAHNCSCGLQKKRSSPMQSSIPSHALSEISLDFTIDGHSQDYWSAVTGVIVVCIIFAALIVFLAIFLWVKRRKFLLTIFVQKRDK
jgi:hypothetical protein